MKTKICPKCKIEKSLDAFPKNKARKDGVGSYCLECTKEYSKQPERAKENKKYQKSYRRARRDNLREWLDSYKSELSCEECGENHPACLEFHHVDPDTKVDHISRMIRDRCNIDQLKAEIAKCKVLCANCHRKEHWGKFYS